ncbi:hypothetical protein NE852_16215 [Rhizobium sp. Pop5]|uniref:hypothetical protein n=1 Tax=Rhizobium sp. Pop5 TaxID=1223565 RepID=UPI000A5A2A08|nr:hypothetical protein [Rhizobium sp. Pop5]UVD55627.1 hypothetical protein NE852_16215 [Rhizobium sp. Pop5]
MLFSWPLTARSRGFTPKFLLPGQIISASRGVNGKVSKAASSARCRRRPSSFLRLRLLEKAMARGRDGILINSLKSNDISTGDPHV